MRPPSGKVGITSSLRGSVATVAIPKIGVRVKITVIPSLWRRISKKGGLLRSERYSNIKSVCFAFPGVCSPVEAGEVARTACRRRGDQPRGLHFVRDDNRTLFT